MTIANTIDINVFSICILAIITLNIKKRAEHAFVHHRLYRIMVIVLALELVAEIASSLVDGKPGPANTVLNWSAIAVLYLMVPLIPSLWTLYADFQVFHSMKRFRNLLLPLCVYVALDWAYIIASIFTGWMFTIDANNVYRRGDWLALHTLPCYGFFAYTFLIVLFNRKRINSVYFYTLLAIGVPPVVGGIIQALLYGVSLIWSGMALSLLLLYFNIQDHRLDTDYLTGAYNRRLLDRYIREKVRLSAGKKTFSAVLLDLNGFKRINDTHGHAAGDEALTEAVRVLRSCIRGNDFIARWGGDEFLIVLDIGDAGILEETVERIRNQSAKYNGSAGKPFELSFSIGYAVYDRSGGMDADAFLKHVDRLMYEDKKRLAGIPAEARP